MKRIIEKLRACKGFVSLSEKEAEDVADYITSARETKRMLENMLAAKDEHIAKLETELSMRPKWD